MLKTIALDDEPPALRVIESFCAKVEFIDLQQTFTRPTDALQYIQQHSIDLIFLDINMPSTTGIDFYRLFNQPPMVIFTTAYSEYAVEGFNLSAIDYLLKPFTYERFLQAVRKAHNHHTHSIEKAPYLMIKADYSTYKILLTDVLFIEGLDDYLKIHLQNTKPVVARLTMKSIQKQLPADDFIRVHRSFIVPFGRIKAVRNRMITLSNDQEIPIGITYEADFAKRYR